MKQFSVALTAAVGAIVLSSVVLAAPAKADNPDLVADAIQDASQAVAVPAVDVRIEADRAEATAGATAVDLPVAASEPLTLTNQSGDELRVTLPFSESAEPGTAIGETYFGYDNANSTSTVPILREDGILQITTVIADATAPVRYEYKFDVDGGAVIEPAGEGALVWTVTGSFVAAIGAPWAVDALGAALSTRYEIEDGALVQYVDHTSSTEFPVVADPAVCGNIFSGITTGTENGQARYGLVASACGTSIKTGLLFGGGVVGVGIGQQVMINAGWNEAIRLVPALTTKASLRQQYDCHTIYAAFKNPWNLEKFRPNKAGWPTAPQQCNWS
ncbi:hypothetical protein BH11ACT5_BH11ACT5_20710 [soil metagenome]